MYITKVGSWRKNQQHHFSFDKRCLIETLKMLPYTSNIIRIHHECKDGIEKSVLRITVWHHKACQGIKRDRSFHRILINNGLFFLLTIKYLFNV